MNKKMLKRARASVCLNILLLLVVICLSAFAVKLNFDNQKTQNELRDLQFRVQEIDDYYLGVPNYQM